MKDATRRSEPGPAVLQELRAYTALDNPIRLRTYLLIHDSPGLSFSEIAKQIRSERGLVAYHVGVLKAADLVKVDYQRAGRETTAYRLTERGDAMHEALFGPRADRSAVAKVRSARGAAAR